MLTHYSRILQGKNTMGISNHFKLIMKYNAEKMERELQAHVSEQREIEVESHSRSVRETQAGASLQQWPHIGLKTYNVVQT